MRCRRRRLPARPRFWRLLYLRMWALEEFSYLAEEILMGLWKWASERDLIVSAADLWGLGVIRRPLLGSGPGLRKLRN